MSWPGHQQQKYVDKCYLSHLWQFLDSTQTHLWFEFDNWLCPQRQGDLFIMEQFIKFTKRNQQWINPSTMMPIIPWRDYTGRHLLQQWMIYMWMGIDRPRTTSNIEFIFPTQSCPSKPVWNTWTCLLQLCFCHGSTMKLSEPLGWWYQGQVTQTWNTVLEPKSMQIFIWDQGHIHIYECQG